MSSVDNVEINEQQMFNFLDQIGSSADFVLFPEASLYIRISDQAVTQPTMKGLDIKDPVFDRFAQFSKENSIYIHLGSVPLKGEKGKFFNATILFTPQGEKVVPYHKIHLFDVSIKGQKQMRESDQFTHGTSPSIYMLEDWKIGFSICYDLRFSELYYFYALNQVDLITVPSAFLVPTGKAHWEVLLRARAIETQSFVLAAAQAGVHQSQISGATRESYGHSMIIDPWGRVIAQLESGQGIIYGELDFQLINEIRSQIPIKDHRRLHL